MPAPCANFVADFLPTSADLRQLDDDQFSMSLSRMGSAIRDDHAEA
jgi:hypothetical protein